MTEHSPGPWRCCMAADNFVQDVNGNFVATVDRGKFEVGNAHLIETAPTLLETCESALEVLIGCCVPAGGCDDKKAILDAQADLRFAINKATGRKP